MKQKLKGYGNLRKILENTNTSSQNILVYV